MSKLTTLAKVAVVSGMLASVGLLATPGQAYAVNSKGIGNVVCTQQSQQDCTANNSGHGTSGNGKIIIINHTTGGGTNGGNGKQWHQPAEAVTCIDQGGYPKYIWLRKVTISGITYNQDQVTCSWTPQGASAPWTLNNVLNVSYCQQLSAYVDPAAVLQQSRKSSPLSPYFTVHAWETSFHGESLLDGSFPGGCLVRWLTPVSNPGTNNTTIINVPPASYVWSYILSMTPEVTLPSPSFETWSDPTVTNSAAPTSFTTFPHEYWGNNSAISNVAPVNYPLVVAPTISKTTASGTYSAVESYVAASVGITDPFTGTVSTISASLPVTFTAPYSATFSNMVVWSGTDTNSNSTFEGYPVLEAPINPITPYSSSVGTGETGSLCSQQAMANSQAVFASLSRASAASANGQDLLTGDGYTYTSSNQTRYGDCTITYRIPSGYGPGPNGDYPVTATGNWNVTWGKATVTVGGASGSQTYCPATSTASSSNSSTTTTNPCVTESWSIPGWTEKSRQPPWPVSAFSASSNPLYVNVGIADAVSQPVGRLLPN